MRIQFCGADRTVTGSSHLLEVNGLRVFLDMGMYQGQRSPCQSRTCLCSGRPVTSASPYKTPHVVAYQTIWSPGLIRGVPRMPVPYPRVFSSRQVS